MQWLTITEPMTITGEQWRHVISDRDSLRDMTSLLSNSLNDVMLQPVQAWTGWSSLSMPSSSHDLTWQASFEETSPTCFAWRKHQSYRGPPAGQWKAAKESAMGDDLGFRGRSPVAEERTTGGWVGRGIRNLRHCRKHFKIWLRVRCFNLPVDDFFQFNFNMLLILLI